MRHSLTIIVGLILGVAALGLLAPAQQAPSAGKAPLYNNAKAKLLAGKQIMSFTQGAFDVAGYCESAKHFDFGWIEMQHSTMSIREVETMIGACPYSVATPIIRVPDALEFHVQQATDAGALGLVVPTVDDVARAQDAAKWSHYPPQGRRSMGGGQYGRLWNVNGVNYRNTINDNMLIIVMLETPTAIANAFDIASVPGLDVIIIGNSDLASFSGFPEGSEPYEKMVAKAAADITRAGKFFGQTHATFASGPYSFGGKVFQNGPSFDGWTLPGRGGAAPAGRGPAPR